MALKVCPDCKSQVSDQAPYCPKCGRPIRQAARERLQRLGFISMLVFAVLWLWMGVVDPWLWDREQAAHKREDLRLLVKGLARLSGEFTQTEYGTWQYTPYDHWYFRRIEEHGDNAVPPLVDCLNRTTDAQTKVDGKPVPAGVMCYEALTRIATLTEERGDEWPGHVKPTATRADLEAAKAAWQEVVADRAYTVW
jgi:hypothetical protein